jgi:hypothetical protein
VACAKPPEPDRATPPSSACDFVLTQVLEKIAHAHGLVSQGNIADDLDREIAGIKRAIERLRNSGATDSQIRSLEGELARLVAEGFAAIRTEAESGKARKATGNKATAGARVIKLFKEGASEEAVKRARKVLTTPGHWAFEAFRKEILRVVEGNGKIPDEYKDSLAENVARLLVVCPEAGGLVAAMVTRDQPKGSFLRKFSIETPGSNDAIGAAYEIMGTAALCQKVSTPSNTKHKAPELHIDPTKDKLVFGPKAYMNHHYAYKGKMADRSRQTSEGDAQFYRDGREIAIDFKHVKGARTRSLSKDLRNQVDAVKMQIKAGQYSEFHFVTNGKFSPKFKEAVDAANDELLNEASDANDELLDTSNGEVTALQREQLAIERQQTEILAEKYVRGNKTATSERLAKIALHEYVTSIPDDPLADGEIEL